MTYDAAIKVVKDLLYAQEGALDSIQIQNLAEAIVAALKRDEQEVLAAAEVLLEARDRAISGHDDDRWTALRDAVTKARK